MRVNADENITNWNDSLREIIRRLDWDYFELNDKSKKILENTALRFSTVSFLAMSLGPVRLKP